jgi:hypothetical protein
VVGPALIVAGVLVKIAGFVLTGDTPPSPSGRTVTTLGTSPAERGRTGTPSGRTSALRRARSARAERATARATEAARAVALDPSQAARRGRGRRAS